MTDYSTILVDRAEGVATVTLNRPHDENRMTPEVLERLAELVDAGALRVHVEESFPFERVAEAHRLAEDGHVTGKVVLTVA
jgi:NADPH:quinone reductase-like Zn-dependent oxidoreductase